MLPEYIKDIIKKRKKEKELVELYCRECRMGINKMYIHIRAVAIRKEFKRQHNHKISLFKKIYLILKGGE